jgi:hypothetical protein
MTGGAYGPEGGIIATIVIVLSTAYLLLTKKIRPTLRMEELLAAPSPLRTLDSRLTILPSPQEDKGAGGLR